MVARSPGPWLGEAGKQSSQTPAPLPPWLINPGLVVNPSGAKGWQRIASGNGGELVDYFAFLWHAIMPALRPMCQRMSTAKRKKLWQMASTPNSRTLGTHRPGAL